MNRISLSFIFGAGIVTQVFLFIFNSTAKERWLRLAMAAGFALFGLTPGKHEHDYELHFHICYCFVIFAFVTFLLFKEEIMARVSESSLLVNSLLFWYLCVSFFHGTPAQTRLMLLAALPTLATLVIAFTIRQWSFAVRLSCYAWFLALILAISCFQVQFGNMSFILSDHYAPPNPFNLFLTGMAFTYLAASLFYIYILIPLPGKNETFAHRMETWRADAHLMAGCFSDYQLTAAQALTIILFQGGLYVLNFVYRWVAVPVMMNLTLLLLPRMLWLVARPACRQAGATRPRQA